ncbi:MAG: alpha/beta hydrolase family protein [Solirubrobacteraceae bacterium]
MPRPEPELERRGRPPRRYLRFALVVALISLIGVGVALALAPVHRRRAAGTMPARSATPATVSNVTFSSTTSSTTTSPPRPHPHPAKPSLPTRFAVGLRVLRLVDRSRTIRLPGGRRVPRTLVTYVRYPAAGPLSATDRRNAPLARVGGPFPLLIFGHGFTVTPAPYARLLQSWARAGYVVAAPVFPLENANAPGGPNEADLVNQPADMSFLISQLLRANGRPGALAGALSPHLVAVSGQSDGGETALAVAYDRFFLDHRVRAAVILSGAEIPGVGGFTFPAGSPPLLATQGTADTINPPSFTSAFFDIAPRPKYLLELLGAGHLPPYSGQQPQLGIIERVTTAFLDLYLKHRAGSHRRLAEGGNSPGIARLIARP